MPHNGNAFARRPALPFVATGLVKVRPPPSLDEVRDKILPTALCSAVTMFTGNFAYIYLSVAFIQILKVWALGYCSSCHSPCKYVGAEDPVSLMRSKAMDERLHSLAGPQAAAVGWAHGGSKWAGSVAA
jgi:hypothetical protein